MGEDWVELERGTTTLYGACGGLWVMIVFGSPTNADMLLARPSLAAMKRRHPEGFPSLTWVLPTAGYRMDHEARVTAATVTAEFDGTIRAQATLLEGTGFQVATVRAVIAGLDMMSRSSAPKRTFSELEAAVTWCLHRLPPGAAPGSASAVARAVRAAAPVS